MGGFQFPAENILKFYGTTTFQSCIKTGGVRPIQVLGLVPCDLSIDKFGCGRRNDIVKVPAFSDQTEGNSFMFEYPSLDNPEDFRMQRWNGTSWVFATTALGSGQLSANEGVLYTLNGGFPNYKEYAGFQIDWSEIYDNDGAGYYRFLAWSVSESNSLISLTFDLKYAEDNSKDGTVRITIDSEGDYPNPFYSINNEQRRKWDLINLDSEIFPNGWVDDCYYYGKVTPNKADKEELFIRRVNDQDLLQYDTQSLNMDLNLYNVDYNLTMRLNSYGGNSYNIRLSDCNKDSTYNFLDNYNIVFKESPDFNSIPNNRKLISTKFAIKPEVHHTYKP